MSNARAYAGEAFLGKRERGLIRAEYLGARNMRDVPNEHSGRDAYTA